MAATRYPVSHLRPPSVMALAAKAVAYLLLSFTAISMIFPFYWMVATSLKTEARVFAFPPEWIPNPLIFSNYVHIFTALPFGLYVYNSLKVSLLWTLGVLLSSSLAAYAFARVRFWGRETLFIVTLAALMIPAQVTMIPLYVIMSRIGWVDTQLPLIVPAYFGSAFGIFLMRQYFMTIPQELNDAAKIDGCSHFGIYWRIMMPLSKPVLATLALLSFMGSWNDLLGPIIYLYDEELFTLPLALTRFRGMYYTEWANMMAGATVSLAPILLIFLFTQQYFVRGVVLSGLKG
ncbi:MAG TPA: carbohydrate ABC transporter permease [Caldilineaceae bacterium]|nr:carbohydrate ABC transporter permease [Caldilineaceae bacterium]